MARRTVRSLTPRAAAASRADRGQVSAAPDTPPLAFLSVVRSSMVDVGSATGTIRARAAGNVRPRRASRCAPSPSARPGLAGSPDGLARWVWAYVTYQRGARVIGSERPPDTVSVLRNADRAAQYPGIPCTPPPGGVEDEQRYNR